MANISQITNYTPTNWTPGLPITQERMNNIEAQLGLLTGSINTDVVVNINAFTQKFSEVDGQISGIGSRVDDAVSAANTATAAVTDGQWAWEMLTGAGVQWRKTDNQSGTTLANILEQITGRITTVEGTASGNSDRIEVLQNNVNGAKRAGYPSDTLRDRFEAIDTAIARNASNISSNTSGIANLSNSAKGTYTSLAERLNAIDNSQTEFTNLPDLGTEVRNARGINPDTNAAYTNLNMRLNAMDNTIEIVKSIADNAVPQANISHILTETNVNKVLGADQGPALTTAINNAKQNAIETAEGYADTYKVAKTSIYSGLDKTIDDGSVLDARQGKVLKDAIDVAQGEINAAHYGTDGNTLDKRFDLIDGGSKPERTLPSIITEVNGAHRAVAQGEPEDTLDDRFDDIERRLDALDTPSGTIAGLDDRIDAIDGGTTPSRTLPDLITEINNAHINNGTLDDRFDTLETQVTNIANELNMTNIAGQVQDTTSRIDQLETNVVAMANEIGMLQNGTAVQDMATTITGQSTRIDTIETEVGNAHRQNGDTLDARFDAIEIAINHTHDESIPNDPANGLTQRLTIVENSITGNEGINARLDAIETDIDHTQGENDEIPNGLKQRLTAAEERLNAIGDTNSGMIKDLADTDTALDTRLDAIDGGSALDITNGTLSERVATNELKISHIKDNNNENDKGGLEQRMDAAEGAIAGKANSSDLANKANVTDVSFTIIKQKNEVTYITNAQNETVPSGTQNWTIVERNDYLLQNATDDKYYYWKYIGTAPNGNWHLISGAGGGTGNTSGADLTRAQYNALASTTGYAENTDYYVTEDSGLIRHYRYVTINNILTEIEIGPLTSNIKRYNISSGVETVKIDNVDTDITYLYLHEFDYGEDNDEPGSNTIITRIALPAGGGTAVSSQKMVRITERNITQPLGAVTPVELKFFYTSGIAKESGLGDLYIDDVLTINDIPITSGDPKDASSVWPTVTQENPLPDGFYSIDVSEYCTELVDNKEFRIRIKDPEDTTGTMWKELKWNVTVMNLTISSTFTEHSVNTLNSKVKFIYIANGSIDKVVNFKLGNTLLPTVNLSKNTSGVAQEYEISMPQAGAGAYRLEAWLTATANGHALPPSQSIYRDIIWYDASSNDIIMSSPYRDNVNQAVTQYDTLEIPYTIVGGTAPYTIYYYVDDMSDPINQVTLNSGSGTWEFRADDAGVHNLKIACGSAAITFSIKVTELPIDIAPEIRGLILDFNPQGITNSSNKRLWNNGTYHMTVSNNFDWYNGGYGSDESGDYFLIKAGTRAVFDYKMFVSQESEGSLINEVFENGKELKIIFKTAAVRNADAVWFTNMGPSSSNENAKQVGIQLNAHNGFLKTDSASNVEVGGVAATNTYLYFPYSEEDKIELDININQASENNNFIMSYEDGCPSKAYPYKTSEVLYHIENQERDITIGSDDCDVYIYRMRVYDRELTTEQVLRNFIADGKNSTECITRYNRNAIYYDNNESAYTPYPNNNTVLSPERLAIKIPDIKVLMLETPRFTTNKKDFVPYSSLRCIHAPGGKYFKSRGKEDNWLFQNGYHAGQGTTSDKYGNAGRNLDFLFMCDGIHNPSDKITAKKGNFLPGYQSSLILGYGTEDQDEPTYCLDWKDEDTWTENKEYEVGDLVRYGGEVYKCIAGHTSTSTFDSASWALQEGYTSKITLTSTSIPNNFFNLKVNIASSENANNALLQKRYNDFLLYSSPAHERDNRIKNDMEFVPAVIFVRETGIMDPDGAATAAERQEFNDDQWHFYALGNIGDSKKTDYTRAYDPQDMNEFTLEISDNNTNNSQFQSGVYWANYYRQVTNPIVDNIGDYYVADGITGTVEYNNETQYYGNFIKTLDVEINNEHTYYTFIEQRRAIEPYTLEQDMDDGKPVEGSFTARSAAGQSIQTTEYLFPLQEGEWNSNNMRYWSLFNEGFDGEHSFEMRYACKGDYRDGKVVNDTTGRAQAQLKLNEGVWRAFYTWLVTSDNSTFVNELDQWVVRSSVEYYYAFTHYYTMMDNRAKNTFWHFAKTGKHRKVTTPVAALLHIYEEADGTVTPSQGDPNVYEGTFVTTSDATIDSNKQYYTQYAFDMWVYDTDTALGIDNNGELVFPYGKEDTDYRIEGDASSSMVFNGAGSIFWCRLRDNCIDDIRSVFTSVQTECFNATTLINEFDKWQECYPEAIWRLDVERKYIRSFTGDTGPNGVYLTRKETRFLRDMMQGRKKYQRRQWVKDQDIYFGSKYMLPSVRDDFFEFSCYQPAGQAVTPNWDLTITPYQDMYINISYAETFASPFRAKAGVTYEFKSLFDQMNDSRIRVFGANHIQGLAGKAKREDPNDPEKITGADGLASFYIKANNFEHGKKLRKLILGTDNPSYQNGNFTSLNIANDYPILEEFNIKNCGNLGGPLDFSNSTALKIIEAQGTQITQVKLPSSTDIEVLHLPETITKIELKSAKRLNEITIKNRSGNDDLSNLTQLDINDSDYSVNVDWLGIASTALNHLDLLSLLSLNTASIVNISELEAFKTRKESITRVYLSGTIKVTGSWSAIEKSTYETTWFGLTLDTSAGTEETKYSVTYTKENPREGGESIIPSKIYTTLYINGGDPIPDIYATGVLSTMPTKPNTPEMRYTFGNRNARTGAYEPYSGWKYEGASSPLTGAITATENIVLEEYFKATEREYNIRWFLDEDKTQCVKDSGTTTPAELVKYGKSYGGNIPGVADIHSAGYETCKITLTGGQVKYDIFNGWSKPPIEINPDGTTDSFDIIANWNSPSSTSILSMFDGITPETMQPEHLYVYSSLKEEQKTLYNANVLASNSRITYQLGYDSAETGTVIKSDKTDPWYLSGNTSDAHTTNIQPFAAGNDAFTLVVDFGLESLTYNKQFATIMSCYHSANNVIGGIGLFYDSTTNMIYAGYGSMYKNSDQRVAISYNNNASMRNIVVFRHPADSAIVYIYSSSGPTQSLPIEVFGTSIQRTGGLKLNTNAYLNFGQLIDSNRETIYERDGVLEDVAPAIGNIYWAKYWPKDLGEGESKLLASWPHEYLTFGVPYKYKDNDSSLIIRRATGSSSPQPSLYLATLNEPMHGQVRSERKNKGSYRPDNNPYFIDNTYGWGEDYELREVMNKRLYTSLPIQLQAILCKADVQYRPVQYDPNSDITYTNPYIVSNGTSRSRDYVFGYSIANLQENANVSTGNYEAEDALVNPFAWLSSANITVYNRSGAQGAWTINNSNGNDYYLNLRFPGKAIKWGAKSGGGSTLDNSLHIYYDTVATSTASIASTIGGANLRSGDIYIDSAGTSSNAYIYVSNAEITRYGYVIATGDKYAGLSDSAVTNIDSNSEGSGGWIPAESYWIRSVICNSNQGANFAYVTKLDGQLQLGDSAGNNRKLNYLIAL